MFWGIKNPCRGIGTKNFKKTGQMGAALRGHNPGANACVWLSANPTQAALILLFPDRIRPEAKKTRSILKCKDGEWTQDNWGVQVNLYSYLSDFLFNFGTVNPYGTGQWSIFYQGVKVAPTPLVAVDAISSIALPMVCGTGNIFLGVSDLERDPDGNIYVTANGS